MLSLESERPDARLDAWRGQVLSFFFNDANSTTVDGTFDPADVHAALSSVDFCPVAEGNVLNMTVRRLSGGLGRGAHVCSVVVASASSCVAVPPVSLQLSHAPAQVRLNAETTFEGAPVRDDLLPAGTTVQVLVGHLEEMQERGHDLHLVAHMADATQGADATC